MNDKTQLILNFINESSSNMPYVLKDKLIRDGKKLKYRFEFEEIKNSIDEFIEGNELNALHGAQRMLDEGKIDVIQMEFGGCNIDSRTYFRDFWNLLSAKYKVYRVLLDGVEEITEYRDILEIFFCTNYLFVRK